jgi:hypothetical protein
MKRLLPIIFILLLVLPFGALFGQEQEEPPPEDTPSSPPLESDWSEYNSTLYSPGDKTFTITLGMIIPTYFTGDDITNNRHGLKLGGTGTLAFSIFLTPRFFVGAELSGMFSSTRGKNMLYMVPFGARIGYQFVFRRFEFPITLMIGAAPQKYIENGYIGLILKGGVSVFWRFNPDWSFGLNGNWWFIPQWPKNGYNAYGNFMEVSLSARYHF